jgi:hypothetical protein
MTKKVGIIIEAPKDSGDQKVFTWLIENYCKNICVEFIGNRNKNDLFNDSPDQCEGLFNIDICDEVLIIYDLKPRFNTKSNRVSANFKSNLIDKLARKGLPMQKISIICIKQMLETWLIADENAVRNYKIKKHKLTAAQPYFNGGKRQLYNPKPKKLIEGYLSDYNPTTTALEIMKEADLITIGRRCDSFVEFQDFIHKNCTNGQQITN